MFWKFLKKQSDKIRSVSPALFFEKAILKMFGKFLENRPQQRILKAHNYAEYELCHWCFPRNFMEKFRTAILKEYFLIDAPCLIKEHFRMSASDEAALKFLTQERQTFPQSNILSHILCLLIYYIGEHNIFYYKDFFSLVLTFLFHEHNSLFCNCKSRD